MYSPTPLGISADKNVMGSVADVRITEKEG